MREIFKGEPVTADPGKVFYTITKEDIGNSVIRTPECAIYLTEFMGRVRRIDVGKRLYRVGDNKGGWLWQVENDRQRDQRLAGPVSSPGTLRIDPERSVIRS